MKLNARIPVYAGLMAVCLLSATGCQRLRANDQINKGVADFKNAKLESATNHFQQAVQLDPSNPNPLIYLGTVYSSQVVPNLDTPENKKMAQQAIDTFQRVLSRDPNNVNALEQIASIERNTGHPAEAKQYEKKVLAVAPNNPEANYTIGVVDWVEAYKNATKALSAEGLTDKADGNVKLSKKACSTLVEENTPLVTEGLQYLQKAIDLRSNYEEAMTYMSLMYRRKADLECGNLPAVKADLQQADMWAQKSMGARAANEKAKEKSIQGGITEK